MKSGVEALSKEPAFRAAAEARAAGLVAFIDRSPTPYHAVVEAVRRLEAVGFSALDERVDWQLSPGARRYVVRSNASIVAFVLGKKAPAESGFAMIGAHTDSPNLRLKPRPSFEKQGYLQLGVEVYGGVLLHTWLDRDLSIAGRVAIAGAHGLELRLVDLVRPVARVPSLAIHLNRRVNDDGLKLNPQKELPPLYGLAAPGEKNEKGDKDEGSPILDAIARELGVERAQILDHDLSLYDVTKGAIAGLERDLLLTARLDNQACCYAALSALVENADHVVDSTRLVALYDHEEVGSESVQGAAGPLLESVLRRVVAATDGGAQGYDRAVAASFMISADMAHAVHPNYVDKHEPQHMPMIGKGPVLKSNVNQRYATDGASAARFTSLCKEAGFSPQLFVTRSDLACGSTIGPITATRIGVRTVDVGNPMLSMHSIREMCGTLDAELMQKALGLYFRGA